MDLTVVMNALCDLGVSCSQQPTCAARETVGDIPVCHITRRRVPSAPGAVESVSEFDLIARMYRDRVGQVSATFIVEAKK